MYYYEMYVENSKGLYTYKSEKKYEIGQWCVVNFIRTNKIALVVKEIEESKVNFQFEKIKQIIEKAPILDVPLVIMKLTDWIKDYYLSDYDNVFKTVYPGALKLNYSKRVIFIKKVQIKQKNTLFENEFQNEIDKFNEYMEKKGEITLLTLEKKFSKDLIKKVEKLGGIEVIKKLILNNKKISVEKIVNPFFKENTELNEEQKIALERIKKGEKSFYLLKGVTGSGKTEIYINLIKESLIKGEGSIFLVPEISLTTQMIERLEWEFKDSVAILHSKLTNLEKKQEWTRICKGEKKIVIGARSAIFAPVKNLANIIIDEEHENTYKQEQSPRYHTKNVAIKRAMLEKEINGRNVKIVLGSATPSFESYYQSKNEILELIEINKRYNNSKMPKLKVIDLGKTIGNFSRELLEKMAKTLEKDEQIMLILNRKSFSPLIKCKECGEISQCPNCSISLSYYKIENKMKCNYCGYEKNYIGMCYKCKSDKIIQLGSGTEKIEEELRSYFPRAKIVRVDSESIKNKGDYEKIYKDFKNQKYDIMIGTQIIAKGFHFPNVTLVGIINADIILNFPDFRAGEKTFQLLIQSAGRAGRGEKEGEVYIQTFNEENEVIKNTVGNSYESYYEYELKIRKEFNYPPFGKIITLIVSAKDEKVLENKVKEFYINFEKEIRNSIKLENNEIISVPFKAPIYRVNGRFRYEIFIKINRDNVNKVKKIIKFTVKKIKWENVRISIDVDPINMM